VLSYPTYKEFRAARLTCQQCNWRGQGRETEFGETTKTARMTQYHCPTCGEPVAKAPWPRIGESQD
jgi:predicted RNA-binding Zn-ribbon protein involved in translation (DUF1610 family)